MHKNIVNALHRCMCILYSQVDVVISEWMVCYIKLHGVFIDTGCFTILPSSLDLVSLTSFLFNHSFNASAARVIVCCMSQ